MDTKTPWSEQFHSTEPPKVCVGGQGGRHIQASDKDLWGLERKLLM